MAAYIRRERARFEAERYFKNMSEIQEQLDMLFCMLPAENVSPVRHGRWGTHSDRPDSLICSVCKCGFDMWKHDPHNYCPNCGAKMDLHDECEQEVER